MADIRTDPKEVSALFLQLVDKETSYNLRGGATIEFAPTGLVVRVRFPDRREANA